jgi:hypothetical protein
MSDLQMLGFDDPDDDADDDLRPRAGAPLEMVRSLPHAGTYAGVALIALGIGLLALAWGRTAGLTDVGRQVPYLISAGFGGLAVVVIGVVTIAVSAARADAAARRAQAAELRAALSDLRRTVEEQSR